MKSQLTGFMAGLIFGIGLTVSQMTRPEKVIAFLDVFGDWDPSLALVLGASVIISLIGFRLAGLRARPLFADVFHIPTRSDLDGRLILGAAIFGVGWGLGGYCPGPAIAALTNASWEPVIFIVAMVAGSMIHRWTESKIG